MSKVDPLTEARRFSRQTRFMLAGGATARPVHELDAVDRVCDELEALRTEADALTARAERAERERDALRECLSALEAHAAVYEEFAQAKGRHAEAWELEDKARLEATHRLAQEKYEPVRAANVRLKTATAAVREACK